MCSRKRAGHCPFGRSRTGTGIFACIGHGRFNLDQFGTGTDLCGRVGRARCVQFLARTIHRVCRLENRADETPFHHCAALVTPLDRVRISRHTAHVGRASRSGLFMRAKVQLSAFAAKKSLSTNLTWQRTSTVRTYAAEKAESVPNGSQRVIVHLDPGRSNRAHEPVGVILGRDHASCHNFEEDTLEVCFSLHPRP